MRIPDLSDLRTVTEAILRELKDEFPGYFSDESIQGAGDVLTQIMKREVEQLDFEFLIGNIRTDVAALISLVALTDTGYFDPWKLLDLPIRGGIPYKLTYDREDESFGFLKEEKFSKELVDFYVKLVEVVYPWSFASRYNWDEHGTVAYFNALVRNLLALDSRGLLSEDQVDSLVGCYVYAIYWYGEFNIGSWTLYYYKLLARNPDVSKRARIKAQKMLSSLISETSSEAFSIFASEFGDIITEEMKNRDALPYFDSEVLWLQMQYLLKLDEGNCLPACIEEIVGSFDDDPDKKAFLIKEFVRRNGSMRVSCITIYEGWAGFMETRPDDKRGFMKKDYSALLRLQIEDCKRRAVADAAKQKEQNGGISKEEDRKHKMTQGLLEKYKKL